jgi:hypothetical protein
MNEEQFEATMVDTAITLCLAKHNAEELKREYDVDINGDLVCYVWGKKPVENIDVSFVISKNEENEYTEKLWR